MLLAEVADAAGRNERAGETQSPNGGKETVVIRLPRDDDDDDDVVGSGGGELLIQLPF